MWDFSLEGRIDTSERRVRRSIRTVFRDGDYSSENIFKFGQLEVRRALDNLSLYYALDNRFSDSLGCIHASGLLTKWFYEIYCQGLITSPLQIGAGYWDDILLMLITKDRELIHAVTPLFKQTAFDDDQKYFSEDPWSKYRTYKWAYYLSQPLSMLLTGDIESAKKLLSLKRAKLDAQFRALCGAMDAIVACDKEAFDEVIKNQIRAWKQHYYGNNMIERYVNTRAVSLICLAEYVWEEKVKSDYDEIINSLVCQTEYSSYPLPADIFRIPTTEELETLKNETEQKKKPESFISSIMKLFKKK